MRFEMYQQFENRKSGRIAYVARVDDVCKTVVLMYEEQKDGDKENGLCMTFPTVSKNWKRLDSFSHPRLDDVVEEQKEEKQEEETAGDGTAYSEVMQEILADEKQEVKKAVEKKKAEKKERLVKVEKTKKKKAGKRVKNSPEVIDSILKYVFDAVNDIGGEIGVPREEEMKFRALRKKNGRQFCKLVWSAKSVKLYSKEVIDVYPHGVVNYNLPNYYEFTVLGDTERKAINTIISVSYKACKDKNDKKKED